jgi:preprotein translocase subunit SecD
MLRIFHNTSFDFIRWWRWAAGLTIAFIVAGLATFAVTLIAGIVASLFTAIFVTRTFYMWWLQRTRGAQPLSI